MPVKNKYIQNSHQLIKKPRFRYVFLMLRVLLIVIIIATVLFFLGKAKIEQIEKSYESLIREGQPASVNESSESGNMDSLLVLAVDDVSEEGQIIPRVAYLEQFFIHTENGHITRIPIPPETVPNWQTDAAPLNHLILNGINQVIQRTEEIMSLQYDAYLLVNLPYLRALIDSLDGIEIRPKESFTIKGKNFNLGEVATLTGLEYEQLMFNLETENREDYLLFVQTIIDGVIQELLKWENIRQLDRHFLAATDSIQTTIPFESVKNMSISYHFTDDLSVEELTLDVKKLTSEYGEVFVIHPDNLELLNKNE